MVTTSNASFTPKQQLTDSKPSGDLALGIHLGDKSEPMQTINQLYFDRKQPSKNSLPETTMKELRNTHFNLGLMPQQYRTENDYYKKTLQAKESQGPTKLTYEIPSYDSGTWVDKQAKFYASTTSKQELPSREVKPFERAIQVTRSGIDFGGHNNSYASEFKQKYPHSYSVSPPHKIHLLVSPIRTEKATWWSVVRATTIPLSRNPVTRQKISMLVVWMWTLRNCQVRIIFISAGRPWSPSWLSIRMNIDRMWRIEISSSIERSDRDHNNFVRMGEG